MEPIQINCAEACKNGCVLGDQCPNTEYRDQAANFIASNSLDRMLEIAEERIKRRMSEPPQWILPDDETPLNA